MIVWLEVIEAGDSTTQHNPKGAEYPKAERENGLPTPRQLCVRYTWLGDDARWVVVQIDCLCDERDRVVLQSGVLLLISVRLT